MKLCEKAQNIFNKIDRFDEDGVLFKSCKDVKVSVLHFILALFQSQETIRFFPNLNSKHFFVGGVRFSFLLEPSIEDEPKIISHPI